MIEREFDVLQAESAVERKLSCLRDLQRRWKFAKVIGDLEIEKLKAEKEKAYELIREEICRMEEEIKTSRFWLEYKRSTRDSGFEK